MPFFHPRLYQTVPSRLVDAAGLRIGLVQRRGFKTTAILAMRVPMQAPTSTVVDLGGNRYLLRPKHYFLPTYDHALEQHALKPALVLSVDQNSCSAEQVRKIVQDFDARDDVFCADFVTDTLVLQSSALFTDKLDALKTELQGLQILESSPGRITNIILLAATEDRQSIPVGPYFIQQNHLFEAWRLYDDKLSAFQTCVIADAKVPYAFESTNTLSEDGFWKAVAVPSRLYTPKSSDRPLAGVRIAVKDVFRLSGIKASLNARSFLDTYGPDVETSEYVKKLIDLGAIIVGKSKTAAFAGSEKAPEYWIDFQCPFNPRGDGYQVPSGSTSGGAACLAGYDWLDFSFGTDTYGSIRAPAAANGLYGLRCTVGDAVSLNGIYPQCKEFDTMGVLSRDLAHFLQLAELSFEPSTYSKEQVPTRIVCPTDWQSKWTDDHHKVVGEAVAALEKHLGVERQEINFSDEWARNPAPEAEGKSFQEFFKYTGYNIFYHDAYHQWDTFRADHFEQFGYKEAVGPHTRFCWNLGAKITADERDQAVKELKIYRKWMTDILFPETGDQGTTIVVHPQGSVVPDYRDEMTEGMKPRVGPDPNSWGAWLGIPQLVLPIDNCDYESRISGRTEQLPASAAILGPKGSDRTLIRVAMAAFHEAGLPTTLQTGKTIFG